MINPIQFNLERSIALCFLILAACSISVFAQNDWKSRNLKARPQIVEEYSIFYPTKSNPTYKKRLRQIQFYNSDGKLIELYSFNFQGERSYYRRTVNTYDAQGRGFLTEYYQSEQTKAENLFLPDIAETGFKQLNPNVKEKLSSKSVEKFNPDGSLSERSVFDGYGELTSHYIYSYPGTGERIFTHILNGVEDFKSISIYKKKERKSEDTTYKKGKPVYKSIHYYDKERRSYYIEQFNIKPSPDGEKTIETFHARNFRKFKGNTEKETETYLFDENGSLTYKSLFWRKDNHFQKQMLYKYQPANETKWVLQSEKKEEFQYDNQGSQIKFTRYKREAADKEFYAEYGTERIIKYY